MDPASGVGSRTCGTTTPSEAGTLAGENSHPTSPSVGSCTPPTTSSSPAGHRQGNHYSSTHPNHRDIHDAIQSLQIQQEFIRIQLPDQIPDQFQQDLLEDRECNRFYTPRLIKDLYAELSMMCQRDTVEDFLDLFFRLLQRLAWAHGQAMAEMREKLATLTVQLKSKEGELKSKQGELKSKQGELKSKQGELKSKEGELKSKEGELKSKEGELKSKEGELKSKEGELKSKEGELKSKEAELKSKDEHLDTLKKLNMELQNNAEHWKSAYLQNKTHTNDMLGSLTTAEAWKQYQVEQLTNIHLEPEHKLVDTEKQVLTVLGKRKWACERDMYEPLVSCLATLIPVTNAVVWNTSTTRYLGGLAPDLTITLTNIESPESTFAYGVIELKQQDEKLDTDSNLGQLATYLTRLHRAQPERTHFWGVLSNIKDSFLLTMTFDNGPMATCQIVEKSPNLKLEEVVQYIRANASQQAPLNTIPARLPFPSGVGKLHRRLATTAKWMVGQFLNPIKGPNAPPYMVVKSSLPRGQDRHVLAHHVNELLQLRRLNGIEPRAPPSIAQLIWEPNNQQKYNLSGRAGIDFGITPCGIGLDLGTFSTPEECGFILKTILDGLEWLHAHAKTIHRDLRLENVVYDKRQRTAVIIDFDCAWNLPSGEQDFGTAQTTYGGGIMCTPTRVLADFREAMRKTTEINNMSELEAMRTAQRYLTNIKYAPVPADDLCAFVLLVLALLYPRRFRSFKEYKIFEVSSQSGLRGMERLLGSINDSPIWGPWWKMAKEGNVSGLRGITDVIIWPFIEKTG
ncbi:hypothetical protein EV426DRAFT_709612 [Tirmania nivea]|nr:hypothetical protein EV426DRAFT_709612 [Tirmania nivea]